MQKNHISDYNKAINIIEDKINNSEEITNDELAKELGYEQHYFSKIFQKYSNMTIQEYIKKRKMSHALKELTTTKNNISDIAEKYLYSSDGFTKAFKDVFGVTPAKLKNTSTNKDYDINILNSFTNRLIIDDYSKYIDEPRILKIQECEQMKFEETDDDKDLFVESMLYQNGPRFYLGYYKDGQYDSIESCDAYYSSPFVCCSKDSRTITIPKRKWLVLYTDGVDTGITLSAMSTYARYEWVKKQDKYYIEDGYEIGYVSECFSALGAEKDGYELWVPIKEK